MDDINKPTEPERTPEPPEKLEAPATSAETAPDVTESQVVLPEKLKGKSAEEITKAYLSLEKKLGEQSTEVGENRKKIKEWEALGTFIAQDPELKAMVERKISPRQDPQSSAQKPKADDTRMALENQIVADFKGRKHLGNLDVEKRSALEARVGKELRELVDPMGKLSREEFMEHIELNKLPYLLEKAYRLATLDDVEEQARLKGHMEVMENNAAIIGSFPASSANAKVIRLTPDEQKVARKMGLSDEEYFKNK